MNKSIYVIIFCTIIFFIGFFVGKKNTKPEIKIVEKRVLKWKNKTIYRNYVNMDQIECMRLLKKYDNDKPFLDGKIINKNVFRANAGLCERNWEKDFKLKTTSDSYWQYYLGFGVCAGAFLVAIIK